MLFKKAVDFFLFTSLYIAVVAVAMVYQTFYLFHAPAPLNFYLFVFFGTLSSYNFHWFLTPPATEVLPASKNYWNRQNRQVHFILAVISLAAAAFFALTFWALMPWLAITAVLTFLYTAPKLPIRAVRHLKKIAYGKTVYLALVWTHVTVALPLLLESRNIGAPEWLFIANRFLLIYAICILFDLRDRERDKKDGIKSLITYLSAPRIDLLFYVVIGLFTVTCLGLTFYFPHTTVLALFVPAAVTAICYRWFKTHRSDYVYYFILDGLMILSLPLLFGFSF